MQVQLGCPIVMLPQQWKQIDVGDKPCMYVLGYTPKGLHKLSKQKKTLILMGFHVGHQAKGSLVAAASKKFVVSASPHSPSGHV